MRGSYIAVISLLPAFDRLVGSCTSPSPLVISDANVPKSVPIGHENGPRRSLRGPFCLVAGTGFEPATSGL
jgi:hypothetical protein